jgi:glycosyltransferase involved in cell wall biosynthesis/ribosomal protein S18 acetylase RimI-like enzyme
VKPVSVAHLATVDLTHRFLLSPQLQHLRSLSYEVTAISAPGRWAEDVSSSGIRFLPWGHATRTWAPWQDLRAFLELTAILRRERFALVHTHTPKAGILGRIAARLAGTPCVMNTVHGLYAVPEDGWVKRAAVLTAERLAARFSDLELYQSAEDLSWARQRNVVSPDRSRYLGNGVDLAKFHPGAVPEVRRHALRAELGIAEDSLVVGTVGRVVREKGYGEFLAVARELGREFAVKFVAAGAMGSDAERDRRDDAVLFLPWSTDIREILSILDVFVLASWREGVPRSALEAAAMGKPLVLSDIRGCREIVRPGLEGMLVPARDPKALAGAIRALLVDKELRQRMGEAARRRAEMNFSENRVLKTIQESYATLLAQKGILAQERGDFRLRSADQRDLSDLVRLHSLISGAFLVRLGESFLRALYRALLGWRPASVIVAEDKSGRVVGSVVGVPSVRAFYSFFLIRHGLSALVSVLPGLFKPSLIRRLLETATYPRSSVTGPDAELLAIAVTPEDRGRGVGRYLVEELISRFRVQGVRAFRVVAGASMAPANRFYESLGFRSAGPVEIHQGMPSQLWIGTTLPATLQT